MVSELSIGKCHLLSFLLHGEIAWSWLAAPGQQNTIIIPAHSCLWHTIWHADDYSSTCMGSRQKCSFSEWSKLYHMGGVLYSQRFWISSCRVRHDLGGRCGSVQCTWWLSVGPAQCDNWLDLDSSHKPCASSLCHKSTGKKKSTFSLQRKARAGERRKIDIPLETIQYLTLILVL